MMKIKDAFQFINTDLIRYAGKKIIKRFLNWIGIYESLCRMRFWIRSCSPKVMINNLKFDRKFQSMKETSPLPNAKLRFLVAASYDKMWFYDAGLKGYESIKNILSKNNINLESLESILDFGCGCGRVTRHFYVHNNMKIYGTDYNPTLIRWSQSNLTFANFSINGFTPPTKFETGSFDMIFLLSVFTHLNKEQQESWLEEYFRLLKKDGYLILSVHGKSYHTALTTEELNRIKSGELAVRVENRTGTNYCGVYHPENYFVQYEYLFKQLDLIVEGASGNPTQDLLLFQKQ